MSFYIFFWGKTKKNFSFLQKKKSFPKNDNIFLPNQTERVQKKLRPPDWPQLRPPTGPETEVFFRLALDLQLQ